MKRVEEIKHQVHLDAFGDARQVDGRTGCAEFRVDDEELHWGGRKREHVSAKHVEFALVQDRREAAGTDVRSVKFRSGQQDLPRDAAIGLVIRDNEAAVGSSAITQHIHLVTVTHDRRVRGRAAEPCIAVVRIFSDPANGALGRDGD